MGSKSAIGIGNGICFKQVRDKGGGSYIDPLVRDSLVGVWIADKNTNESPTRNIIKNTIKDKGGDLELLNFGYKLNSGYGKYEEDFTTWRISKPGIVSTINVNSIHITRIESSLNEKHAFFENTTTTEKFNIKLKISGLTSDMKCTLNNENSIIKELVNGVNEISVDLVNGWYGFTIIKLDGSIIGDCDITIEQIPSHQGALVTDGKDDLITSTKTVKEMLGGSNEVTVVSMMLNLENEKITYTNQIRPFQNGYIRNNVISNTGGKYGIYGYKITDISDIDKNTISINDILGDRKDCDRNVGGTTRIDGKFSVEGYCFNDGTIGDVSQVAWYWTIIAKIALTTDQINQVISYFNLDKHVKPDIIYNTIRQGITNENHASFNDELVDFSGNGHNMKIYNSAWKLGSGIGKYEADYSTWTKTAGVISTPFGFKITEPTHNYWLLYTSNITVPAHKVEISGIPEGGEFRYLGVHILKNGINELPKMEEHPSAIGFTLHRGTTQPNDWVGLSVEQIPDYEGALVSDGKDDYGKAEGLPILKDYTVATDYARLAKNISSIGDSPILSKSMAAGNGAFIMNSIDNSGITACYSFGTGNSITLEDIQRKIYYQSKYSNQGKGINAGSIEDGTSMWLDTIRDNDTRFIESAFYSMLLFPYSLSEFLLERQLKRYKLGTLYPDMIEWRPIAKSNIPYKQIDYFIKRSGGYVRLNPGDYFQSTEDIIVRVTPIRDWQLDVVSSIKVNGKNEVIRVNSSYSQTAPIHIDKSPQKIDITIDEYTRYEDIVQPYPAIINLKQDGKTITWGDKLKVGSDIVFVESANLLPELYTVSETRYNGVTLYPNTIIKVEKSMVFDNARTYLKANEPSCILSPNRLRIPNSSYKILGYIPDLTGKGNHGRLNNFAYTEESGANEDGSIRFDGTDDHITIPTLAHGGKQVLMKVNLQSYDRYLYDQRNNWDQYLAIVSASKTIAYEYSNKGGKTYIDGILNEHIIDKDLLNITHNITATNANIGVQYAPNIGTSFARGNFAQMALFDFMLFPDISSEEEIKELNEVMGIEGGYVERPEYYWDAYGKTNSDADRATIIDQVSKDPANALTANNFAFNEESGYVDNRLVSDGIEDNLKNTNMPVLTDYTWITKRQFPDINKMQTFVHKGSGSYSSAFLFEFNENGQKTRSFGHDTTVVFPDLISYQTKNSYNGEAIAAGDTVDGNQLRVFMGSDQYPRYAKAVFYKAMLYSKTIDALSINMLKNLFERDELIDITNPIFKKKEL